LKEIDDFFSFKDAFNKFKTAPTIEKIFIISRDLRPQIVSFSQKTTEGK
jgi:hypothetical protein